MQSSFLLSLLETIVGLLLARLDKSLEILLPDSVNCGDKSNRFKTKRKQEFKSKQKNKRVRFSKKLKKSEVNCKTYL